MFQWAYKNQITISNMNNSSLGNSRMFQMFNFYYHRVSEESNKMSLTKIILLIGKKKQRQTKMPLWNSYYIYWIMSTILIKQKKKHALNLFHCAHAGIFECNKTSNYFKNKSLKLTSYFLSILFTWRISYTSQHLLSLH